MGVTHRDKHTHGGSERDVHVRSLPQSREGHTHTPQALPTVVHQLQVPPLLAAPGPAHRPVPGSALPSSSGGLTPQGRPSSLRGHLDSDSGLGRRETGWLGERETAQVLGPQACHMEAGHWSGQGPAQQDGHTRSQMQQPSWAPLSHHEPRTGWGAGPRERPRFENLPIVRLQGSRPPGSLAPFPGLAP